MKRSIEINASQDLPTSMLKESIKAASTAGAFYKYIAEQIRNGFIRRKFIRFSDEESKKHANILNDRLTLSEDQARIPGQEKPDAYNDVSSYSLIGAFHVAKESARKIIMMCKGIKKKDVGHSEMYDEIIKDEKIYYKAVKMEENFPRSEHLYDGDRNIENK